MGDCGVGDRRLGVVSLEDQDEIDKSGFEDVDAEVGDVEVENWEDREGYGHVDDEEEEVVLPPNPGESCRAEDEEAGDGEETEDHVAVLNSLDEEGFLDEEVQVEGSVQGEEQEHDSAEGTMVGVEFFVGETGQESNRRPR